MVVFILCFYCVLVNGYLKEVELPDAFSPPSQDSILKKYFKKESKLIDRSKKSIESDSDKFYKSIEFMKNDLSTNIINLRRELWGKNASDVKSNVTSGVSDLVRHRVLETTTYRYPTATWNIEKYEKLKALRKTRPKKLDHVTVKRGKTKWKDRQVKNRAIDSEISSSNRFYQNRIDRNDQIDKFLEESLFRYLVSSKIITQNVTALTDMLKNVTETKQPKKQSLYDENKELRIKFKNEVLKRKNEQKTHGILEKQLQKRLEKMPDFHKFHNKKSHSKSEEDKHVDEATEESTAIPTIDAISDKLNATPEIPTKPNIRITEIINNTATEKPLRKSRKHSEVNLSVAETMYYRKRHFPEKPLLIEQVAEASGVIPGIPEVDYPMYSNPPVTGFKCPSVLDKKPKMMADTKTRCQVFYVCTGDGPAAAMLCPNGTMFNENVSVCDWWYNVDC